MNMGTGARPYPINNHANPSAFHQQDPAFNEALMAGQGYAPDYFGGQGHFPLLEDENDAYNDRYNQYQNVSAHDSHLTSPPTSQFGSPPDEYHFPKSPVENIRTALNAPLPQSFDSNGISHIAQYGPLGQSVPDKFGLRSPNSSGLSRKISAVDSPSTLRSNNLNSNLRNVSSLGRSPHNSDESIPQRIMHSQRPAKPQPISMSVPRANATTEWDDGLGPESDLLPNSLYDEVLTPQERLRRSSRPEQDSNSRDYTNPLAIPSGTSSKIGSPGASGSPSRFSGVFQSLEEQRQKKSAEPANVFGHVGSPLRESWMPNDSTDASRGQISGISQAMARMQVNRTESSESNRSNLHTTLRHVSAPLSRFDRTISSPGLGSKKIEEEVDGVFMMDENDGQSPRIAPLRERINGEVNRAKRNSGVDIPNSAKAVYGFQP